MKDPIEALDAQFLEVFGERMNGVLAKHHPEPTTEELLDAGFGNDDIDGLKNFVGMPLPRRPR